jgi:hypothetical protein
MKKLLLTTSLALSLTFGAFAQYSLSLTTNERGEWAPVATYKVGKLTNVLGSKKDLTILGFAGYNSRSERPVLAGALVYSVRVAGYATAGQTGQTVTIDFGPAVRVDGSRPKFGAFVGIGLSF